MQEISIETHEAYPFAVIGVGGWLAQTNVYQLKHQINRLVEYNGFHMIVLDLAGMAHLDSGGVSVVMGLYRLCRDKGGLLAIVEPLDAAALNPMYYGHLKQHIPICGDREAALRTISQQFGISLPAAILHAQADAAQAPAASEEPDRTAELEQKLERAMQRIELLEMSVFTLMEDQKYPL